MESSAVLITWQSPGTFEPTSDRLTLIHQDAALQSQSFYRAIELEEDP